MRAVDIVEALAELLCVATIERFQLFFGKS